MTTVLMVALHRRCSQIAAQGFLTLGLGPINNMLNSEEVREEIAALFANSLALLWFMNV